MKFSLVSLIFLCLAAFASAVPNRFGRMVPSKVGANVEDRSNIGKYDTNAKRLAAGLPPAPARRLWTPTLGAKRWVESSKPPPPFVHHKGKVIIKSVEGTTLGFVSKHLNKGGFYVLDGDENNGAVVSFTAARTGLTPKLSIQDTTSTTTGANFFGAVIQRNFTLEAETWKRASGPNGGAGSASSVGVSTTAGTGADSGPQGVTSGAGSASSSNNFRRWKKDPIEFDAESGVWTFDPSTGQWTGTFQNYDGSRVNTVAYFDPDSQEKGSAFALVSNATDYLLSHPNAQPITMGLA